MSQRSYALPTETGGSSGPADRAAARAYERRPRKVGQLPAALVLHFMVLAPFIESARVGPVSIGRLIAAVAVATLVAQLAFTRWRPHRLAPVSWLPPALFAAWALASGLWAAHHASWLFAMGQISLALAYFVAFAFLVTDAAQVRPLLRTYTIAAVASAGLGAVQFADQARATGLQGDPNLYSLYLVAAIPAALALASGANPRRRWWLAALVPMLAGVVAAQSRGAVVATVVVLVYLGARGGMRGGRPARALPGLVMALIAVGGLLWAASNLSDRFDPSRVEEDRASGRLDIWHVALRAYQDHPALGLGAGNFKPESIQLLTDEPGVEIIEGHLLELSGIQVHNVYLETLSELGPLGAALFVATVVVAVVGLGAAARMSPSRPELAALMPMLLAYAAGATFLSIINSKLLWLLVGTAAGLLAASPAGARGDSELEISHRTL